MDNDIVGRRYIATDTTSIVWVVSEEIQRGVEVPHALLRKSGDPGTTKLIAVSALTDRRRYRRVE